MPTNTCAPPSAPETTRARVKRSVVGAFRDEFPTDTIDVTDGFEDLIHVVVISRRFDGRSLDDRADYLCSVLDRAGLPPEERGLISLLAAISPGELSDRLL